MTIKVNTHKYLWIMTDTYTEVHNPHALGWIAMLTHGINPKLYRIAPSIIYGRIVNTCNWHEKVNNASAGCSDARCTNVLLASYQYGYHISQSSDYGYINQSSEWTLDKKLNVPSYSCYQILHTDVMLTLLVNRLCDWILEICKLQM